MEMETECNGLVLTMVSTYGVGSINASKYIKFLE